ncbi:hypothetical protein INT45_013752 [Circinella minor]|uniref:Tc1-like transposase DDE domain-containing protein n=1 Tax=Circinella minor TaxID=1195481 RepID=A0A8H7RUH7_9FUNG|nr:hypothetical protein INT45_013752 [Circinella minor]
MVHAEALNSMLFGKMVGIVFRTRFTVATAEPTSSIILHRNFNRSKRVSPARAVIPSQRGVSIAILGAICELGIINVSLRKPQSVQSSKKRKQNDGTTLLDARIGTRAEHFIKFLNKIINILDENNIKRHHLVMDNASIHTNQTIAHLVEQHSYKCIYLAPFYPPPNRIVLVKGKTK